MSSKVLSGGEGEFGRFEWRRLAGAAPAAGATQPSGETIAALQRRLTQMESEAAQRERQLQESAAKAGYEKGFRDGEAAARAQLNEELRQIAANSADCVQKMLGWRSQLRKQMEEDLVHLAVVIARRILHREVLVDKDALVGIVKAALEKIELRELHRIRVATLDKAAFEEKLPALPARVEVVADPALPRGSLLLETVRGQLDCSIEEQLREIDRGLADVVRRAP